MFVYTVCAWCLQKSEKGVGFPDTRVIDGYKRLTDSGN